jgi:hypothetical protein
MSAIPHQRHSHVLRTTGWLVVVGMLVALALVPDRFLPGGQGIDVEGTFAGTPVELAWSGNGAAPYRVGVAMKTGLCEIAEFDAKGAVVKKWSAQKATDRGRIQRGGSVKLLADSGAEGYYHLRVGPLATWGPMLMAARVALLGMAAAIVALWLFGVRVHWWLSDPRHRHVLAIIGATAAVSGLVLYSIVHEAGHMLFGWLWGATPAWDHVSWTLFAGEEPHASFRSLPHDSEPWMAAGGMLLPTLVGCVLVAAGLWQGGRVAWWLPLVFVTTGGMLLLGNLGLFADTGHTLPLAIHLGFYGVLAQIVALLPAMLTLAIYGYIGYRLRFRVEAPER